MMCSSSGAGPSVVAVDGSSSAASTELSAEGVALTAQIKAKGDAIRDLKTGGASKDDLRPHIEVNFINKSSY